nr:molybdenum cofactor guanylyltransferase [Gemmatimonadota bacterium]NIQ58961.1 molybdenum cofactor guanylyltransferase [Gemmatimonadota bacterium]NIU79155.1 NTP transferase domain-containing protein [Gammaproteobacteria bacterium]NIX45544.1 NTP transferase domain-containing protein [Gemmatimonadota bacterium]NIY09836.1 NTP transferase domain-containing protein [Gemmatimonadota bacterium]
EPELYRDLDLPVRPDLRPGLGALGGLHTGLHWAREAGRPGILAVACDMPFVEPALLSALLDRAADPLRRRKASTARRQHAGRRALPDVVLPESRSQRGVEPLCAYYATSCLAAVEARLDRDDHRMIGFHDDVAVATIPLAAVERLGDPAVVFMNVNTREDRDRAEAIAATW